MAVRWRDAETESVEDLGCFYHRLQTHPAGIVPLHRLFNLLHSIPLGRNFLRPQRFPLPYIRLGFTFSLTRGVPNLDSFSKLLKYKGLTSFSSDGGVGRSSMPHFKMGMASRCSACIALIPNKLCRYSPYGSVRADSHSETGTISVAEHQQLRASRTIPL